VRPCTPVIPALARLRQKDGEVEPSLSYTVSSGLVLDNILKPCLMTKIKRKLRRGFHLHEDKTFSFKISLSKAILRESLIVIKLNLKKSKTEIDGLSFYHRIQKNKRANAI
jgi:hypothetical protein